MALDPNEYERKVTEYRLKSRFVDEQDDDPNNGMFILFLILLLVSIYFLIFKGC